MNFLTRISTIRFTFDKDAIVNKVARLEKFVLPAIIILLTIASVLLFKYYLDNGLGLAYNDARSHLNIGRRVVEGLKPGIAQLGSVWLPLPHILMVLTIWNDYMWHTGLSGALQSMVSFVVTGAVIYKILEKLKVSMLGRVVGVLLFATNLNIIYLQSTAMTELLLIATMTLAVYELILWHSDNTILNFIKAAFWVMLSTLIRYDGWFLCAFAAGLVLIQAYRIGKFKMAEGLFVLYCTLAGLGVFLWLVWNLVIFGDPLFFAFGPYSAHAQQQQLDAAGVLLTKNSLYNSMFTYWYALAYNSNTFIVILSFIGAIVLFFDKKIAAPIRLATTALMAPLFFNIIALYLGHSVLFVQGINGDTWFNVRYGIMMMPSIAVFVGYLIHRLKHLRWVIIGLLVFVSFFAFVNKDAVTIEDGRVGSSQKNVSAVSGWLNENTASKEGFILVSAASHDAIIFSSGLPMTRIIHEGTGDYWENATTSPDRWARWIVMRTNDTNDSTFKLLNLTDWKGKYTLVKTFPFADIYELKPEYMENLNLYPVENGAGGK